MSDLHLGLVIFGLLVIIGVVTYNWIQERKFRKIAQQRFQAPREDALMKSSEPNTVAKPFGGDTLDDVRIEPSLRENFEVTSNGSERMAPPTASRAETPWESQPESQPKPGSKLAASEQHKADGAYPAPIDPAIDYVARLDFSEPVQVAEVRAALDNLSFGKPAHWLGQNASGQWEALTAARDRLELTALCGALQLADRTGAIGSEDLSHFIQHMQQMGEALSAVVQLPERQAALDMAAKLDEFCADVDILVGVNVIAVEQEKFMGTKVRALAEAGGFTLARDGTYQYCDERGTVLYSLSNQESAPFSVDAIKTLTTHGLTLLFDVPRIPNGLRAFDQMILFAGQLTESLKGLMVDDNLRPLTDEGVAKIKQQLSLIYGKMDKNGIPAGSARAQRLFS